MTDVPSNRNHRIVKVLGAVSAKFAHDPRARRIFKGMDNRRDFDALADLIGDGMDDAGGVDEAFEFEDVVMASAAYYEKLARELIEYARLYPEDAPRDLAKLLPLIELISYGRMYALKERAGLH